MDTNDGTSIDTPWKTINKVNTQTFQPGDNILFNKGETWRETLIVPTSGFSDNPIVFGSYGDVGDAVIDGSDIFTEWTLENSIYYTTVSGNPIVPGYGWANIFYDGARLTQSTDKVSLAAGKYWWDSANSRMYIYDNPSGHMVEVSQRSDCVKVSSKNYINIENLVLRKPIINGLIEEGTSTGGVVSNVVATFSGNQNFQNLGSASTIYYNIIGDDALDDGFSMHDNTVAIINTGSFNRNVQQGIQHIQNSNLIAYDLSGENNGAFYSSQQDSGFLTSYIERVYTNGSIQPGGDATLNRIYVHDLWPANQSSIDPYQAASTNVTLTNFIIKDNPSGRWTMLARTGVKFTAHNGVIARLVRDTRGSIYIGLSGVFIGKNIIMDGSRYGIDLQTGGTSTLTNFLIHNHLSVWQTDIGMISNLFNNDPLFLDHINSNFTLLPISPAIDAGTTTPNMTATTTDYAGNPIYGTPDIGAFEYQPPYSIASQNPEHTGNIRIYGDGKYRYTSATSSLATAKLFVAPAGGVYPSYDASTTRPEYLNLSVSLWDTTGDRNKAWTASSTVATSTLYTIGDLVPNANYIFHLDGSASSTAIVDNSQCSSGVCLADADGYITFTYVGGYSEHTFELIKDSTAPSVSISAPTENSTVSGRSVTLTATASDDIALASIQIKIDGANFGSTSASSPYSLTWDSTTIQDGTHTISATACDNSGNCATSASVSITVRNSGGGVVLLPAGIGTGSSDVSIPMNGSGSLGVLTANGSNLLAYINSIANFTTPTSNSNTNQDHQLTITNLDLAQNIITLLIESTPQTITLNLDETSNIDLDEDGKPDISIKFANIYVNRAELTVKSLLSQPMLTATTTNITPSVSGQVVKINAKDRPAVYYLENGKKYSFVNRGTYTSWSTALGDSSNKFATLKLISQTEFDSYLFGGNLALQPGSLVKFTDSSAVYGVGTGAKLYKLTDAMAQTALYGNITPVLLQGINRSNYFNNGNFVAELTADSQKPE